MGAIIFSMWLAGPPSAAPSEAAPEGVLGIHIGMPADAAREILAPIGRRDARPTRDGGTKEVWWLDRTGYEWISMKTGADGRVAWLTGRRRAGMEVPFASMGRPPEVASDEIAVWHAPIGERSQRVTLKGANRRAKAVTLSGSPP